ncbi:MAG TPA: EscN/YscN/HrcN family type III secretion system ATPase, partial [Clostridia bacterium]|nr:EscN/YscN/HrcN family type III secretion system ATPase [Clostridia bacterium]
YTELVEGDDMNEPISDTVRGILDGHIVLSRSLANSNHYPAIDVLASVSRLMPEIASREHNNMAGVVRNMLHTYKRAQDLIAVGAYKKGTDREIDCAIDHLEPINSLLRQHSDEKFSFEQTLEQLKSITEGCVS